jgi:hypothetical protein
VELDTWSRAAVEPSVNHLLGLDTKLSVEPRILSRLMLLSIAAPSSSWDILCTGRSGPRSHRPSPTSLNARPDGPQPTINQYQEPDGPCNFDEGK